MIPGKHRGFSGPPPPESNFESGNISLSIEPSWRPPIKVGASALLVAGTAYLFITVTSPIIGDEPTARAHPVRFGPGCGRRVGRASVGSAGLSARYVFVAEDRDTRCVVDPVVDHGLVGRGVIPALCRVLRLEPDDYCHRCGQPFGRH